MNFLKKFLIYLSAIFSLCILPRSSFAATTIKIGISVGPSQEILKIAQKIAKERYHINLKVVTFANYQIPNEALQAGDLDANIFQTQAFLQEAIAKKKYKLTAIANTFIYPMGIYSHKLKTLSQIPDHITIPVPNDPSNQGRALLLLQNAGLIELRKEGGVTPTPQDVTRNPKKLKLRSVDAVQIARASQDFDVVVLNNDFVTNAGFDPEKALFRENPQTATPYVNVIVVKTERKNDEIFKRLVKIFHDPAIVLKTQQLFPGALPAW